MSEKGSGHPRGRTRWYILSGVAAVGVVVCVLMHFFPPGEDGSLWPKCVFYETTGLLCPGCGSTRALYAYTHGKFLRGLQCNLLLPLMFLALAYAIVQPKIRLNRAVYVGFFVIVVVFTVLRNLPGGIASCLAP